VVKYIEILEARVSIISRVGRKGGVNKVDKVE
jgi:hypothetical protein